MSINIKKYTKDQMAKMVEEAQEKTAALEAETAEMKNCIDEKNDLLAEYANLKEEMRRKNVALTEQIDQINGEAITRENVIASLKADADALRAKLSDAEEKKKKMNAKLADCRVTLAQEVEKRKDWEQRSVWQFNHPWRNLWAWFKREAARHE